MPCLITMDKDVNTPRLPSYKREKELREEYLREFSLTDLEDQDESHYGLSGSPTQVERIFPPEKDVYKRQELYAASYYGGAVALLEGIKAAGTTDRKAVMEAVKGLKDLKVPVGVITCDENNDLVHNINVARIENKIPKFIKAVSVE